MPAPITHIVLGQKIHHHFFPQLDFPSFIVGTSFPDIRYISQIKREKTHLQNIRLKDVDTKNSFLAGFQIHSLIDQIVNPFNTEKFVSFSLEKNRRNVLALKFYQDKILYPKIKNWPQITSFFTRVYPQEIDILNSKTCLQKWHHGLGQYFKNGPIKKSLSFFTQVIGEEITEEEILDQIKKMSQNSLIKKKFLNLEKNILSLVEKE